MSEFFDLHVHTEFCDGHATAEEMVKAAIALGCPKIGLSTHAPLTYPSYAMKPEREDDYRAEIFRLKEKYREDIEVLCGLEADVYGLPVTKEYDYIIGSCHSLSPLGEDGRRTDVDGPLSLLKAAIDTYFGGDPYAAARQFINLRRIVEAEQILSTIPAEQRGAEWHFLMGCIAVNRGHYVDAQHFFDTACGMDPANPEYREAQTRLRNRASGFSGKKATRSSPCSCCGICTALACADCCCDLCAR